ncbi:MAG: hypothetical protein QW641_01025 [Candidatus Aenigmatarchaeota archaeon]
MKSIKFYGFKCWLIWWGKPEIYGFDTDSLKNVCKITRILKYIKPIKVKVMIVDEGNQ